MHAVDIAIDLIIDLCGIAAQRGLGLAHEPHQRAGLLIELRPHPALIGASGLGSFLRGWIYPAVSDRIGRKSTVIFIALLSATVPRTYQVAFMMDHPWIMATAGFIANGRQGIPVLALVLVPTESVPARLAATAIGLATLLGEIFGGALAPTIAGAVADKFGLGAPLWIASGGVIAVFIASIFLRETAPSKITRNGITDAGT